MLPRLDNGPANIPLGLVPTSQPFSSITNHAWLLVSLTVCLLAMVLSGCTLIGGLAGAALPYAGIKMMFACIPERTRVDTPDGSRPVEELEAGDMVIGFRGQPVRILQKHSYWEDPETVFLCITFSGGGSVDLCGMHRLAGIRAGNIRIGQVIAGRHVVGIETRRGETRSFDLLTEDAGYQIQGLPVNSMILEMQEAAASNLRSVRE